MLESQEHQSDSEEGYNDFQYCEMEDQDQENHQMNFQDDLITLGDKNFLKKQHLFKKYQPYSVSNRFFIYLAP